jgi:hypothetical protein
MKCDDCLSLLAEYIDGEATERDAEQVSAHLITCTGCAKEFEMLTAEQEIFARYDRELNISPAVWQAIEARTTENRSADSTSRFSLRAWLAGLFAPPRYGLAGALAVLIVGVVMGVMYLRTRPQTQAPQRLAETGSPAPAQIPVQAPDNSIAALNPPVHVPTVKRVVGTAPLQINASSKSNRVRSASADQSDVLFSDIAYSDIEDKDTADHIAQAQNLLRSIRNIHLADDNDEVDVTYEKAMSRRLLDQNVVLRRDAEMSGKFPVKSLLGDLEPFLVDITKLPDKTTANELRPITDRVQRTEIVAALQSY